ncbi:hypothetical protein [Microbulbifer sp. TYP-18]|uniref:hypothetical protein n=1 Tax=Microbulbifer sp. TYP-18 TaxID=3230024 RepID=UPI0034C6DA6C
MKGQHRPVENALYIQLWAKRIRVTDIGTGGIVDEAPLLAVQVSKNRRKVVAWGNRASSVPGHGVEVINPFLHPRSLLVEPEVAQKLLALIFARLGSGGLLPPSPLVVIQPMEKNEGGLTAVELLGFEHLCLRAGARKVYVYQGPELTRHTFDLDKVVAASPRPASDGEGGGSSRTQWVWILIWFVIIAATMIAQHF